MLLTILTVEMARRLGVRTDANKTAASSTNRDTISLQPMTSWTIIKDLCIIAIMKTPHTGETDSLEAVVDVIKYTTPFTTSYMTKSLGTRLKLIYDGIMIPELKTLCHYYFISM